MLRAATVPEDFGGLWRDYVKAPFLFTFSLGLKLAVLGC